MYIQQADLFWGMSRDFVKDVMGIAVRESYQPGDFLFHEGDPAAYFYNFFQKFAFSWYSF
ncbi:MAG: hypothetical protein ABIK98_10390 [Pseudomonadota bacterium]